MPENIDRPTVEDFGKEWERFDQSGLSEREAREVFDSYFAVFPWHEVGTDSVGFDLGCGSGRWAGLVAPRVAELHCIDASSVALNVARRNLADLENCVFHLADVGGLPFAEGSMDFGYSLGVLHHVPDTQEGIRSAANLLKPGAPLLIYLYYAFDNRNRWFFSLWRVSDLVRRLVARSPFKVKTAVTALIAALIYFPLARTAKMLERVGLGVDSFPLSHYRERSFYVMRTDALDRFGTRIEKRFTQSGIESMMLEAGLDNLTFSPNPPYWCVVGHRK